MAEEKRASIQSFFYTRGSLCNNNINIVRDAFPRLGQITYNYSKDLFIGPPNLSNETLDCREYRESILEMWRRLRHGFLHREGNSFNIRCCIQVQESLDKVILLNAAFRYGMEKGGIYICFTIVKTAFMVWRGHR